MKQAGALLLVLMLAGCASLDPRRCPVGQERLRTAQLFFGRNIGDQPRVTDAEFRRFVDEELTSRFPDGLTILDGGGQWRGEENKLIREASKVVLIVLPKAGDQQGRLDAVRQAYKVRFKQESVMLVTQRACVSF
jgi:Protein of unknown function (DUF3574)